MVVSRRSVDGIHEKKSLLIAHPAPERASWFNFAGSLPAGMRPRCPFVRRQATARRRIRLKGEPCQQGRAARAPCKSGWFACRFREPREKESPRKSSPTSCAADKSVDSALKRRFLASIFCPFCGPVLALLPLTPAVRVRHEVVQVAVTTAISQASRRYCRT